ncbi:MAG: hypothetical protein NWF06_00185 [Candidatus Bathyarchaeota archaeon]|nr:hypothetical protein [Candidatus Bathyarchaeum sp.]
MVNLTARQLNRFLLGVQGVTATFCGTFIIVYLLGLRDLPENVVYHSDSTFRAALSTLGVLALILIAATIGLSLFVKRKN